MTSDGVEALRELMKGWQPPDLFNGRGYQVFCDETSPTGYSYFVERLKKMDEIVIITGAINTLMDQAQGLTFRGFKIGEAIASCKDPKSDAIIYAMVLIRPNGIRWGAAYDKFLKDNPGYLVPYETYWQDWEEVAEDRLRELLDKNELDQNEQAELIKLQDKLGTFRPSDHPDHQPW